MNHITKLYYIITAYIPRMLPRNETEQNVFMNVMHEAYGVPNTLNATATIWAQVGGVQGRKLRDSWGAIANVAKRLDVNKLAQERKIEAIKALQKELSDAMQKEALTEEEVEDRQEFIKEA